MCGVRPHKKAKRSIRTTDTAARGYDNAPTSTESLAAVASTSSSTPLSVGVLAPKPKAKKLAPKDRLNSFGGRNDMGGLSKSVHRILNAGATREEYHENKRKRKEDEEKAALKTTNNKKPLVPLPYESLSAFNRRVEITLRPTIDTAIRGAKASKRALAEANKKARKDKKAALVDPSVAADAEKSAKGKGKVSQDDSIDPLVPPVKVRSGPTEFAIASQKRSITDVAMAPPALKKARRGQPANASISDAMPQSRLPIGDGMKLMMERERAKAIEAYRTMKANRDVEQKAEQGL